MVLFEPIPDEEKQILDLVKFEDVLITYNKNYNLVVNFTLSTGLKGSTLDWIGIFHGGWNKYESFLTFEWGIGEPVDNTGRKRRLIFYSKYLQNAKPNTPYQFVYISKHLEILGVSQFFQFIGDDSKNDSFCLNGSFLMNNHNNNIHNSTEYPENREEFLEVDNNETVSTVKRVRPSCSINLPDNWEQTFTTCWRCKSLFEMKNKHNALIEKLNLCTEQNEQLKERVSKLELALQNAWIPQTLLNPWNEDKEKTEYKNFVSVMTDSVGTKSFETGDHWGEQKALVKCAEIFPPTFEFMNEGTSKELLLKAIIGNQEHHIRELHKKIAEMNRIIFPAIPTSLTNTEVVTLVKAKEKLIPELVKLKGSEDEENIDDNLDQNMNIKGNRNVENQGAAGDNSVGAGRNEQISLD
ncbi:hypothetical protein O3M35_010453 [Rhynocoris fuscipes]|uniref:SKICH domain-containing protein n=1 Tax=Rhynocoris fuscipes TaxID=488301 RepID=A0AAW1D5Z9_9HEMI